MLSSRMVTPNVVRLDSVSGLYIAAVNTTSKSFSHTISGTAVLVAVNIGFNNTAGTPSISATVGGVSMTLLMRLRTTTSAPYYGWCAVLSLLAPPKGSQTITVSYTNPGADISGYIWAVSYHGVSSLGTETTAGPTGTTSPAITSSSTPVGGMVFNSMFAYRPSASSAFSNYNQNELVRHSGGFNGQFSTLIGDAKGTGSTTEFTATTPSSAAYVTRFTVPLLATA